MVAPRPYTGPQVEELARRIMARDGVGFFVARIRAARELFGIPASDRPLNKAEVRAVVVDGSIVPFATLLQAATDPRVSDKTRILAADKYLTHAAHLSDAADEDAGQGVTVTGGLPDGD